MNCRVRIGDIQVSPKCLECFVDKREPRRNMTENFGEGRGIHSGGVDLHGCTHSSDDARDEANDFGARHISRQARKKKKL